MCVCALSLILNTNNSYIAIYGQEASGVQTATVLLLFTVFINIKA